MYRYLTEELYNWKNNNMNKPLMLLGARQVGKTFLLDKFCTNNFDNYHYINLEKQSKLESVFEDTLDSKEIVRKINILLSLNIKERDCIFFDEIQSIPKAITSLKYFNESNLYTIVTAGSLLGVTLRKEQISFPVGKVHSLELYPLNFGEYLLALNKENLLNEIINSYNSLKVMNPEIHKLSMSIYYEFLIVGGMPEAVLKYINEEYNLSNNYITKEILNNYKHDISKYTDSNIGLKVKSIYDSIPKQLFRPNNKFKYSLVESGKTSSYYNSSIEWLINANLLIKSYEVSNPQLPLKINRKDDYFKLFMSDIGLLMSNASIDYSTFINSDSNFRGYVAESFVATQLISNGVDLYYYKHNTSEIDFLINIEGSLIPVEVKSSNNTKSKSLRVYVEKYSPDYSIRISSKNFGFSNNIKSVPLYASFLIKNNMR